MNRIPIWLPAYVLASIVVLAAAAGEQLLVADGNPAAGDRQAAPAPQSPEPPRPVPQGRGAAGRQAPAPAPGNPVAVIATSAGDITVELFKERAPVSVENFVRYAKEGFYDGTIFHRVVPKFMVQGGGFTPDLVEKATRPPIANEAVNGLRNARGTLGMARKRALRSATSQFYINVADNAQLDHKSYSPDEFGYAVFGRVLSGMDVVDRIAAVPTRRAADMDDVPVEPVVITSVTVK